MGADGVAMASGIVRADGAENIVALVVLVLWALGKWFAARARAASPEKRQGSPPASPPIPPASPEEELRRFLEELGAGGAPSPAAPPLQTVGRPSAVPPPIRRPPPPAPPPARPVSAPPVQPPARRKAPALAAGAGRTVPAHATPPASAAVAPPMQVFVFRAAPRTLLPSIVLRGLRTPSLPAGQGGRKPWSVRDRLATPRRLKDAFILQAVLAPPRAFRPI